MSQTLSSSPSLAQSNTLRPPGEPFAEPLTFPALTAAGTLAIAKLADRAALVFLMLATGTVLVRPVDLIPILGQAPIYEWFVTACFIFALPRMLGHLRLLRENGIATLVLLLVPAVAFSHLVHANTYDARLGGLAMAKACIFFLLVVWLIDSPRKLQTMLSLLMVFILVMTVLALMQYHGVINLAALASVEQRVLDPLTHESKVLIRLCGIGLFSDPNDFSLILVVGMFVCLYGLARPNSGWLTLLLLVPLALLAYALFLTHSRGGLLAMLVGVLAFLQAKLGGRNILPAACLLIPLLLVLSSARQTQVDLDNPEDTFQTRLGLWSESMDAFRSAPVLGIGQGKLVDSIGQVTHNSYLHAYAEMGFFGGTAFVGTFYLVLSGLWKAAPTDPELGRLRPYMLALTAGYAAGLLSLSRCYTVPTQLVLAIATVYLVLASRNGSAAHLRFDWLCLRRVSVVGLLFLVTTYLFIRLMLQRG
jgi:putative inorganic carbon (hco3(-)) transporter